MSTLIVIISMMGLQLQELLDREAVRETGYRFADTCNRRNLETFRALWIPEGVWRIGAPHVFVATGVEEIVGACDYLLSQWEFFVQFPHAPIVTIDGDTATSSWTMTEHARNADRTLGYYNHGYYQDRLVRTTAGWKFAERSYTYLFLDATPGAGDAYPRPPL